MADLRRYLNFSNENYIVYNSDVREAGLDPFAHFIQFGRYERSRTFGFHTREGWAEAAGFHADAYLSRYPDVSEAGLDPLWHFCEFGFWEGRLVDRLQASLVWEQLGVDCSVHAPTGDGRGVGGLGLEGIEPQQRRSALRSFLRLGPKGLYGSDAAILLGYVALTVGEPAIAEAFFETYRVGPPYVLKPGEAKRPSVAVFPAKSLTDYCFDSGIVPANISPSEYCDVPAWSVRDRRGYAEDMTPAVRSTSADIFMAGLPNVTIFPGRSFVLSQQNIIVFCEDVPDVEPGVNLEAKSGIVAFLGGLAAVDWSGDPIDASVLPGGISLLGANSRDLQSWVLEKLPRLRAAGDDAGWPALVEAGLPSQYEAWATILCPNAEFISISAPRLVQELKVIWPTQGRESCGLPSPSVLSLIKGLVNDPADISAVSRLFQSKGFAEPAGMVNRNSAVLQDQLGRSGFIALDPAVTSVPDQLRAAQAASIVVAEMGPALINLIACRPETPIVIVCNESGEDAFGTVACIAGAAECRVIFFKGLELKFTHPTAACNDYLVDVASCIELIGDVCP
ncbi:glycosyltransferase 61 family protein [Methylobacterium phyllostachyos]|nr:glycosyltransferase 61 family protein [Methylobacterium phyllostachyos]